MRDTDWTPSIVPGDEDRDVCLVVNDFGRRGRPALSGGWLSQHKSWTYVKFTPDGAELFA